MTYLDRSHLPVDIVGMKLHFDHHPDDTIYISGFGGEDGGVM
jgi:hypothetical protein